MAFFHILYAFFGLSHVICFDCYYPLIIYPIINSRELTRSSNYRGFLPYATFGTWKKVALAKNRISKIFILCTQ